MHTSLQDNDTSSKGTWLVEPHRILDNAAVVAQNILLALVPHISTVEGTIEYLRECGLLTNTFTCPRCNTCKVQDDCNWWHWQTSVVMPRVPCQEEHKNRLIFLSQPPVLEPTNTFYLFMERGCSSGIYSEANLYAGCWYIRITDWANMIREVCSQDLMANFVKWRLRQ